jgi:hypothetical protein
MHPSCRCASRLCSCVVGIPLKIVLPETPSAEGTQPTTLSYLGQPVAYLPCAEFQETSQNVINAAGRCMSAKSQAHYVQNYRPGHRRVPLGRTIEQVWQKQERFGICFLLVTARGPSLVMEQIRHPDATDTAFTVVVETAKAVPYLTRANWQPLLLPPGLLTEACATPRVRQGTSEWSGASCEPCVYAFSLADAIKVANVLGVLGLPQDMDEGRLQPGWSV